MAPPRKQAENRENKRLPTALVGSCLLEKVRRLEGWKVRRVEGYEAGKIEGKKVGRIERPETDYHKG